MKKYELLSTHTARRSFATNLYLRWFPCYLNNENNRTHDRKIIYEIHKITPTENAKLLQLALG
jgi:hypothetical protein